MHPDRPDTHSVTRCIKSTESSKEEIKMKESRPPSKEKSGSKEAKTAKRGKSNRLEIDVYKYYSGDNMNWRARATTITTYKCRNYRRNEREMEMARNWSTLNGRNRVAYQQDDYNYGGDVKVNFGFFVPPKVKLHIWVFVMTTHAQFIDWARACVFSSLSILWPAWPMLLAIQLRERACFDSGHPKYILRTRII